MANKVLLKTLDVGDTFKVTSASRRIFRVVFKEDGFSTCIRLFSSDGTLQGESVDFSHYLNVIKL